MDNFKIVAKEGKARAGVLKTAHGEVETPVFMPVGTQASVKALSPEDLKEAGAQIILGNTYHLFLRPGSKVIRKMGGLHKFMNWSSPILTDSGGFQAFSLGKMISDGIKKVPSPTSHPYGKKRVDLSDSRGVLSRMTEEGVEFKSHLDGSTHLLTPEVSMEVQLDLGSDVALVLDELLSPIATPEYVKESLERTHRWEIRSKEYFEKNLRSSTNPGAQLFGILQGVYDQEIRENEARWIASQDFAGVSIGGSFGVSENWPASTSERGEGGEETNWTAIKSITDTLDWVMPHLSEEWPKHILGIGEVEDFFESVERGADMFDCVAPTRRARNGSLYIGRESGGSKKGKFVLNITRAEFSSDPSPIDPKCNCYTCQNFSRAYLRHLYMSGELLYFRLATIHNVYFMCHLMEQIRDSIKNGQFKKLKAKWL